MGLDLTAIASFFTTSPGIYLHTLVTGSALLWLIAIAAVQVMRESDQPRSKHLMIGTSFLLLVVVTLLLTALTNINNPSGESLLAGILERGATLLLIIWLLWTLLEKDSGVLLTATTIVATLSIFVFSALSYLIIYLAPSFLTLDSFLLDLIWQVGVILFIVMGLILLPIRRPKKWVLGMVLMGCLGAGQAFQLSLSDGNLGLMGLTRLTQTFSLPWLLILSQHLAEAPGRSEPPVVPAHPAGTEQTVDTKPQLVDLLLQINLQEQASEKFKAIARALSLSVVGDICYLARRRHETKKIEFLAGYDLIREVYLPDKTVLSEHLPELTKAWDQDSVLARNQDDPDVPDVETLSNLLKYHRTGNLLAYPLNDPDGDSTGGVILLSPYTDKEWTPEVQQLLNEIKKTLSLVLFGPNPLHNLRQDLQEKTASIKQLKQASKELTDSISAREKQIGALQSTLTKLKARYQIEKLESVKQIETLHQRMANISSQRISQVDTSARMEQLQTEMRQLYYERDQLKADLAHAQARIEQLLFQSGQARPSAGSDESQIISLDSITANVRLKVSPLLKRKGLNLNIHNPDGRQRIRTNPELLQSALEGLLGNAAEASPTGGSLQFNLRLSMETGMLIAEITDHGQGLSQDEQTRIFSSGDVEIPGIGNIRSVRSTMQAIRALNGKIWLRSKQKDHTTFRIQLPVRIID